MLTIAQKELPKALRDALANLAKGDRVREVDEAIQAALETLSPEGLDTVEIPEGPTVDLSEWREGVEDLRALSEDQLWEQLGFPNKALPFFQEWTDPDAMIESWTDAGEKWLQTADGGRERLVPRWHQLVGILRMLQRGFDRQPVLVMDGVGIGKTLQAIGLIACLAFYRNHFEKHGHFPGIFGAPST